MITIPWRAHISLATLIVSAASVTRADTRVEHGAALFSGYTDNAAADFESNEPFGPRTEPPFFIGLGARTASLTERTAYRQVVAL
jgi:hypothetical protein